MIICVRTLLQIDCSSRECGKSWKRDGCGTKPGLGEWYGGRWVGWMGWMADQQLKGTMNCDKKGDKGYM